MDFSERSQNQLRLISPSQDLEGQNLIDTLSSLSGIPGETLKNELQHFIPSDASPVEGLTIEELRSVLLNYLEFVAPKIIE